MILLEKFITLPIVCLFLGVANAKITTVLEKNLNFPNEHLIFSGEYLNDNNKQLEGMPYLLCQGQDFGSYEKRCRIVIQSQTVPEKSCSVTLTVSGVTPARVKEDIKIMRLGSQRVMILWGFDKQGGNCGVTDANIMSTTVDLTTCQSKQLKLLSDTMPLGSIIKFSSVIPYDDSSYDVLLKDHWAGWIIRRVIDSDDLKSNVTTVNETKLDDVNTMQIASVAPHSRSKGRLEFYSLYDISSYHSRFNGRLISYSLDDLSSYGKFDLAYLVQPDGQRKELINFIDLHLMSQEKAISTVHQTVSISFVVRSKTISIWSFDQEGNLKMNTSLAFENVVVQHNIHNLADGTVLLLTGQVVENEKYYIVTKINKRSENMGEVKVRVPMADFSSEKYYRESVVIDENESGGYCLSFVSSKLLPRRWPLYEKSVLNLLVKCFSDEDFVLQQ